MTAPFRPALRWHGGKWLLAPWIIAHFPPHRTYVEPYGGAASVLLRKPRAYAEVYNDLGEEVVALFRILRGPRRDELVRQIALTPFARAEFEAAYAYAEADYELELARRLVVRSFQGFGSDGHNRAVRTGFRAASNRSGTTPAHGWANLPPALAAVGQRLEGVVIERRPALSVVARFDAPDTLHYLDPPYLPETRSEKSRKGGGRYHAYTHEMTVEDHQHMLSVLPTLRGMVVLSGYPAPLYDDALPGWLRVERVALADGASPRREVLWINPAARDALDSRLALEHPAVVQAPLLPEGS